MNQAELLDIIGRAVGAVRAISDRPWRILIVLGSGLGPLADEVQSAVRIPFHDIPGFARSTAPGHGGRFVIGDLFGLPVAIMQGRVHFYEGYPAWQVTLPVRVAKAMGAQSMIVTNAAGGIHRDFAAGDVMLITDHINFLGLTGANPLIGPNADSLGTRFPNMINAYDPALRQLAHEVARQEGINLKEGVYAGLSGPTFETPAEVRFLRIIGADAVGMSTVNEVVVARHAGMSVLGMSGITNVSRLSADEGEPPSHEEVLQAGQVIAPKMLTIIRGVLRRMKEEG